MTRKTRKKPDIRAHIPISGYKGVSFMGGKQYRAKPWRVRIMLEGKELSMGCYYTKEEAARAYDRRAIELYGEHAVTNEKLELYPGQLDHQESPE